MYHFTPRMLKIRQASEELRIKIVALGKYSLVQSIFVLNKRKIIRRVIFFMQRIWHLPCYGIQIAYLKSYIGFLGLQKLWKTTKTLNQNILQWRSRFQLKKKTFKFVEVQ
jgi:hypothetical protein